MFGYTLIQIVPIKLPFEFLGLVWRVGEAAAVQVKSPAKKGREESFLSCHVSAFCRLCHTFCELRQSDDVIAPDCYYSSLTIRTNNVCGSTKWAGSIE